MHSYFSVRFSFWSRLLSLFLSRESRRGSGRCPVQHVCSGARLPLAEGTGGQFLESGFFLSRLRCNGLLRCAYRDVSYLRVAAGAGAEPGVGVHRLDGALLRPELRGGFWGAVGYDAFVVSAVGDGSVSFYVRPSCGGADRARTASSSFFRSVRLSFSLPACRGAQGVSLVSSAAVRRCPVVCVHLHWIFSCSLLNVHHACMACCSSKRDRAGSPVVCPGEDGCCNRFSDNAAVPLGAALLQCVEAGDEQGTQAGGDRHDAATCSFVFSRAAQRAVGALGFPGRCASGEPRAYALCRSASDSGRGLSCGSIRPLKTDAGELSPDRGCGYTWVRACAYRSRYALCTRGKHVYDDGGSSGGRMLFAPWPELLLL